ncbi:30S ribosomal protein S5 [Candidatus Woesearchaeota archaeon]|nr:30S ribosomal protein S5 [Candidatus Woesearchaeota archaeon]
MVDKKIQEEIPEGIKREKEFQKEKWIPKTELGRKVKAGEITDINEIFDKGYKILESEITDYLVPNLESELLSIGQSKGKFGGGKRSIWKQTQKKTKEGNKMKFSTLVIVGNKNGYVGMGIGESKETMPAREKALKRAKVNLIRIKRGCGSWESGGKNSYSIPFEVRGKSGSSQIRLIPAPKGTGLCVENECKKILRMAGIKDIHSKSKNVKTKLNLIKACFNSLRKLSEVRVDEDYAKKYGIVEGEIK